MSGLNPKKIVARSLLFFRRSHFSLALGVAAATAVIIGALVVGDSVRGSLRGLVLRRLSNVVAIVQVRQFVDPDTFSQINCTEIDTNLSIVPIIFLTNCSAEFRDESIFGRASKIQVIGIDDALIQSLLSTSESNSMRAPDIDEVLISRALADELKVGIGDEITLRLSPDSGIPADNPLGRRSDGPINLPRQKVIAILPNDSIGGLQLQSNQEAALNAFTALDGIQDVLNTAGRVNAALMMSAKASTQPDVRELEWTEAINQKLIPVLEDYGLQLNHHRRLFPDPERGESGGQEPTTIFDYYQISSKELLLDESTTTSILESLDEFQPYRMLTYLANATSKVKPLPYEADRRIRDTGVDYRVNGGSGETDGTAVLLPAIGRVVPYSIIIGVSQDATDLALDEYLQIPLSDLRAPYCWINSWLAEQLNVQPGEWIQIQYYEPETVDGVLVESFARLLVAGVVPVEQPESPHRRNQLAAFGQSPSPFNDPDLTPSVPGITDQDSIASWDVPFELAQRELILKQDDKYWEDHRLTPKIFMPYVYSRNLFRSRFGSTTAIRIPAGPNVTEAVIRQRLEHGLLDVRKNWGLLFRSVRFQQLSAASGATPFDVLFLSLSTFVIVAALLLVALLFRLGIGQRSSQLGMFLAQGFRVGQLRWLLLLEMAVVTLLGAIIGIPLGIGYAHLMIAGLETWWIGAIGAQFLQFHVNPFSLLIGISLGVVSSLVTILLAVRTVTRIEPLQLLKGDDGDLPDSGQGVSSALPGVAGVCLIGALLLVGLAFGQQGMARAGFFFGSGMFMLVGCLLLLRYGLCTSQFRGQSPGQTLFGLSIRAISRNPVRSSLSAGLLAVASFLIASMSVFHASPNPMGYGSFDLIGISAQPIYENLGSPSSRQEAIGPAANELIGSTIIPIRMSEGEDASCTNLYQVSRPTILGLSDKLQKLSELTSSFHFSWAASSDPSSPWASIQIPATGDPSLPIPVILDQNTALWSLKQGGRLNAPIILEIDGRTIHFEVVGLLSNTVLQGHLIISERNFERLFPKVSGYRFFFIRSGDKSDSKSVASILEKGWSESGMDVSASEAVMARLLSVQNTYISAFQSLGALGLLLGTLGLVAVQLRSVVERRRELALMQAVGFSRLRLGKLLTLETILLLVLGLLIGVICSFVALIPYVVETGASLSLLVPLLMLAAVLLCGMLAASVAVRFALRMPLLQTLRGE